MSTTMRYLIATFLLIQSFSTDLNARWFGGRASDAIKDWWNNEPGKSKLSRANSRNEELKKTYEKAEFSKKKANEKLFAIIKKKYDFYIKQTKELEQQIQKSLKHPAFNSELVNAYIPKISQRCKNLESILKEQQKGFEDLYLHRKKPSNILNPSMPTPVRNSTLDQHHMQNILTLQELQIQELERQNTALKRIASSSQNTSGRTTPVLSRGSTFADIPYATSLSGTTSPSSEYELEVYNRRKQLERELQIAAVQRRKEEELSKLRRSQTESALMRKDETIAKSRSLSRLKR